VTDKIKCEICGELVHHIAVHLKNDHASLMTLDEYKQTYPDAPVMSDMMRNKILEKKAAMQMNMATTATVTQLPLMERKEVFSRLFRLGDLSVCKNARGEDIHVTVLGQHEFMDMVPEEDAGYIFNIDLLKTMLFALESNIPAYLWGPAGTGKTSCVSEICAYTNRAMMRVNHSLNMVESDVVGDWRAREGNTYFDLGPLPMAMLNGWTFLADEYDRAPPGVVSLYQAVLEGKPLTIKEAPPELRTIKPHRNFRFVATGNTSGSGDEMGLYSGTLIQDAASYSRFGVTEKVWYVDNDAEVAMLMSKAKLRKEDAERLVKWATMLRESFEAGKVGVTVGPRELLMASLSGSAFNDFRRGLCLASINRMTSVDREIALELAQRVFG
jgi:cobaltochelatase CobS